MLASGNAQNSFLGRYITQSGYDFANIAAAEGA